MGLNERYLSHCILEAALEHSFLGKIK